MSMNSAIAYVFPGQGSQTVGMGLDLYQESEAAKQLFQEADDILSFPLSRLCFEGPEDDLRNTVNAQPAIFTASIACMRAAAQVNPEILGQQPAYSAGHSLGEYTALVAAGAMDFPQALRLVRQRGQLMEAAGKQNPGSMAALIGLDESVVEEICQEAGVQIANINSPGQIAISGFTDSLEKAMELARSKGAARVIPLAVSAAFHSRLMDPARDGMVQAVTDASIRDVQVPVVANSTAQPITKSDEIREELINQLCSPVRWQRSVEYMVAAGVNTFIEIGPGQVLTGLIRRTAQEATLVNLTSMESIRGKSG
jgi:[acyl-carrier-protein] S-malonyltransferase